MLDQIKPELSLEPVMTTLRVLHFGHTRGRKDPLENTIKGESAEGSNERGR